MDNPVLNATIANQKLAKLVFHVKEVERLARDLIRSRTKSKTSSTTISVSDTDWEAGEKMADEAFRLGKYKDFDDMESLLADLHTPA